MDNLSWNIKELVISLDIAASLDYLPESLKILTFRHPEKLKMITYTISANKASIYYVNRKLNLDNLPMSLEIIYFNTNKEVKIIGDISNWEFKKYRVVRKKYIDIYEQPKTFSPTSANYSDDENDIDDEDDEYGVKNTSYYYFHLRFYVNKN
jgi:hypothetical protein